jgi:ribonuclease HI
MLDQVFYKINMGLGRGSNNYAELMSLKLLLLFAKEKNGNTINIFSDSQIVVNWVRKTKIYQNPLFLPIFEEIQRIAPSFDNLDIQHVYRERNMVANQLSKAGLQLDFGQ